MTVGSGEVDLLSVFGTLRSDWEVGISTSSTFASSGLAEDSPT